MVLLTVGALVRQALNMLDVAGEDASSAACHLQAALDALSPSDEAFDIDTVASALLDASAYEQVRFVAVG